MAGHHLPPELLREALETARDALDIPFAATVGDDEVRASILADRVMHTVIMLNKVVEDGPHAEFFATHAVSFLRERLTENPATGYRTSEDARERGEPR